MQKKSILLIVVVLILQLVCFSTSDAYAPGRVPSNGNLKKWDITKTQYPNIDDNGNIIIEFNKVGCADFRDFVGLNDEFQAYLNSMNQWNALEYCDAKLVFGGKTTSGKDGNDNKNTLFFDNKGNISPGVFGLTTVTYNANTGEILDADIGLNDTSFAWDTLGRKTLGVSNRAYIEPIMTHEIGHLYGLDHTFSSSRRCHLPRTWVRSHSISSDLMMKLVLLHYIQMQILALVLQHLVDLQRKM